jgi:electron transport complex protein RnfD
MGCTNILVLLACLLFLSVRGTVRWQMPVSFLAAAGLFALLFPRSGMEGFQSVGYELMSGSLLFGAIFMLTEPVTAPKRIGAKILYSVLAGMVVMLFRRFGGMGQMFCFALLLLNAFTP